MHDVCPFVTPTSDRNGVINDGHHHMARCNLGDKQVVHHLISGSTLWLEAREGVQVCARALWCCWLEGGGSHSKFDKGLRPANNRGVKLKHVSLN